MILFIADAIFASRISNVGNRALQLTAALKDRPLIWNSMGTSGNVLEGRLARGEPSSTLENSKNSASSSCRMRPIGTSRTSEKWEKVEKRTAGFYNIHSSFCPEVLHLESSVSYIGRTYSQNCMMENPRNQISEVHFDKFQDSVDFQCWKVNFKTEVCSHSGCPTIAMSRIKEVEVAVFQAARKNRG